MASWADERRSVRGEELEEVGPVDYVVLEWRASSDASEARLAGRRDRVPIHSRRLDARPVRQWVRREGLHERCAPEDAQALES
jgi:hypothetical protein